MKGYARPLIYSLDTAQKKEIEKVADFFGIQPSDIDFTPLEIIECLSNMSKKALPVCEAFRLYEQNFSQFNLPAQVQVAVLEETIRVQNLGHFLERYDESFEEQELDNLEKSLKSVFELNKTFEELCDYIHEVKKKKNPALFFYLYKNAGPKIRQNLFDFVIEPLRGMRHVYDTTSKPDNSTSTPDILTSTPDVLTSKGAFAAHQKHLKWVQKIEGIAKETPSSKAFQELKKLFDGDQITDEEFLNGAAYILYELNKAYKLYRSEFTSFVKDQKSSKNS